MASFAKSKGTNGAQVQMNAGSTMSCTQGLRTLDNKMDKIKRIPVRVVQPAGPAAEAGGPRIGPVQNGDNQLLKLQSVEQVPAFIDRSTGEELQEWRDRALRLQAEMDNYRKRQQRLAQDQIEAERERLLKGFLRTVDNLERALEAPVGDGEGLRHGIELTHRGAVKFLEEEGVQRIEAENQPFDPERHEAVATISHNGSNEGRHRVVRVVEPGYRLGDRLLRPARVIVAM